MYIVIRPVPIILLPFASEYGFITALTSSCVIPTPLSIISKIIRLFLSPTTTILIFLSSLFLIRIAFIDAEATPHIHGALQKIRAAGVKPSVVINPGTPVEAVKNVLNLVDQVLVMTVNPGFGGQAFLPETMDKIRELVVLREVNQLNFDIEVDGGIDDKTIGIAKEAGANVFVAGSYVFKGDVNHQVQTLRDALHD